jgi:methyl-accepting chemotaxis protein
MTRKASGTRFCAALLAVLAMPATAHSETAPAARPAECAAADELTAQDREALAWANQLAAEATQIMERWITTQAVTEEKLFSHLYYPIPQRDPPKYTTDYDALADRDFQAPEDRTLAHSSSLIYAAIMDVNGYAPTHNAKYSVPLTGNRVSDLLNNRTKRMFGDRTGLLAARNVLPYLLQRYKRDTGEVLYDLSVPVMLRGRHFGCVRIGYRRDER